LKRLKKARKQRAASAKIAARVKQNEHHGYLLAKLSMTHGVPNAKRTRLHALKVMFPERYPSERKRAAKLAQLLGMPVA
jgi:hypothetical protein